MEWSALTTGLAVGVVTLLLVKMWQTFQYLRTFKRLGIPGPTPLPFIGNMLSLLWMRGRTLPDVLNEWCAKYGKVFGVFFPSPTLMVSDKEMAREVLIKKFNAFADRNEFIGFAESEGLKDNLLSIKGDHWKHVRNTLSPTFSSTKLKKVVPAMATVSQNLVRRLDDTVSKNKEIELRQLCKCVGMDIIAGVAFGLEVNSINDPDDQFYKHAENMVQAAQSRAGIYFSFPLLGKLLSMLGFTMIPKQDSRFFLSVLDAALKERRQDKQAHNDFLQLLVEAERAGESGGEGAEEVDSEIDFRNDLQTSTRWNRKGLTQSEMHANSLLFLFAGYDTVTTVLSLTLFTLANHPQCLRKAQEEVDEKMGDKPPTYETAMKLTYLDMCMNETMRLHMPLFIVRKCTEDVDISGCHVPKGFQVMVPAVSMHTDPAVWPDPMTFNPERFTAEERAKRDTFDFMPFGLGPRNCIGMRLAQVEIRMMMAAMLRKFSPVLCDKSVYPPKMKPMTAVPKDGLWVRFERRETAQ